jgi:hypothetical protein
MSTAPRANPEASTSISNCLSSCGCAKTGSDAIRFQSSLNALLGASVPRSKVPLSGLVC